jgi:pyruvate formate-lyase activating enzyme-like uncharacterized protein
VAKTAFTQVDKREMQKQMGKAVQVLDQKIAELQKQIDEAKKNNGNDFEIHQMENSLKQMKETRNSLSGSTKNSSMDFKRIIEENFQIEKLKAMIDK